MFFTILCKNGKEEKILLLLLLLLINKELRWWAFKRN
jgi:hypothetical protein